MPRRLSFVWDDELAERIERLARRNGVAKEEVLRQVVEAGLDEVGEQV